MLCISIQGLKLNLLWKDCGQWRHSFIKLCLWYIPGFTFKWKLHYFKFGASTLSTPLLISSRCIYSLLEDTWPLWSREWVWTYCISQCRWSHLKIVSICRGDTHLQKHECHNCGSINVRVLHHQDRFFFPRYRGNIFTIDMPSGISA